jgi:hypothetical protein
VLVVLLSFMHVPLSTHEAERESSTCTCH